MLLGELDVAAPDAAGPVTAEADEPELDLAEPDAAERDIAEPAVAEPVVPEPDAAECERFGARDLVGAESDAVPPVPPPTDGLLWTDLPAAGSVATLRYAIQKQPTQANTRNTQASTRFTSLFSS